MRTSWLAGIAPVVLFAGSAIAADLPVKAPVYKAPAYAAYSWTGCYIGGNVGGGFGTRTGDQEVIHSFNPTIAAGIGVPVTLDNGSSGVVGGGQIGCNRVQ